MLSRPCLFLSIFILFQFTKKTPKETMGIQLLKRGEFLAQEERAGNIFATCLKDLYFIPSGRHRLRVKGRSSLWEIE